MGKHDKGLPARPNSSRSRERQPSRERTEAIRERSRSRAPSNSSASSGVPIPDYYLRAGLDDQRSTPPLPGSSSSRRMNRDESSPEMRSYKQSPQPNTLQKQRKKEQTVPKLTLRKPEDREKYIPEVQSATTPSHSGFSKLGRGRHRESPTNSLRYNRDFPPSNPSSPPPPMPQRRPSDPPNSLGSAHRSNSSDGRINSKLKASKPAEGPKGWAKKGQSIWGKLTSKAPKSAVLPPANFGQFPSKPHIDVVGMTLSEATTRTRVAKELVPGVDAASYWLPAMAYRLISYLNVHGPKEQGIYRVPGSTAAVDKMREEFATKHDFDLFQEPPDDVNTASSLLKSFIRSLPEPILPVKFQEELFEKVRDNTNAKEPPQAFRDMLSSLPPQNYYLLQLLTNHLSNVRLAEEVTRMGLSNLAMIFCSTMKMDRYIFHWLVASWSECWGGCWAEESLAPAGSISRPSFDTRSESAASKTVASSARKEELVGLGIKNTGGRSIDGRSRGDRSRDGRNHDRRDSQELSIPVPPLPTPREPPREASPAASARSKISNSRKRMSGVHDAPDTATDPERGRKRTSREIDWQYPPTTPAHIKNHRRLSSAESFMSSNNSLMTNTAFPTGSTIRHIPKDQDPLSPHINELIGSFRMRARDRRSVDISQLAVLAQQASLNSPRLPASPTVAPHSPGPFIEPLRPRDLKVSSSRNVSSSAQGSPKPPGSPKTVGSPKTLGYPKPTGSPRPRPSQQRADSSEKAKKPQNRGVELLPPMPPMSPLMAGDTQYGSF
ncbi:hypothetical protein H072_4375 [Dactylellina haptotyla CBS 200.50]|uniref:Rho-GAP domain-containing protein n=1 Tax=Dactylellina haptotyla (strain CBS 200.50) TaxID=1284197 RepID=S8AKU7_DACHA|nr:hypothetical protein H072_4375 [Dactylellina haptotyla CBS 200.50]